MGVGGEILRTVITDCCCYCILFITSLHSFMSLEFALKREKNPLWLLGLILEDMGIRMDPHIS